MVLVERVVFESVFLVCHFCAVFGIRDYVVFTLRNCIYTWFQKLINIIIYQIVLEHGSQHFPDVLEYVLAIGFVDLSLFIVLFVLKKSVVEQNIVDVFDLIKVLFYAVFRYDDGVQLAVDQPQLFYLGRVFIWAVEELSLFVL